jgi:hypothetical protein
MPLLGKQQDLSTLSDSENTEGTGKESTCTDLAKTSNEQQLLKWWHKAKKSKWLPWAVASGFGLLWLNKRRQ